MLGVSTIRGINAMCVDAMHRRDAMLGVSAIRDGNAMDVDVMDVDAMHRRYAMDVETQLMETQWMETPSMASLPGNDIITNI